MSRRHHGRSRHHRPRPETAPGGLPAANAPPVASDGQSGTPAESRPPTPADAQASIAPPQGARPPGPPASSTPQNGHAPNGAPGQPGPNGQGGNGCTAPQLRRFIKSRPYVPMHELRRRFGIDGTDDDVTQVRLDGGAIYVGLPAREGSLLGDLLRGGEIGYELSLDPRTPIVVGVYPMRPVPRA
jgi:hypothetical protein